MDLLAKTGNIGRSCGDIGRLTSLERLLSAGVAAPGGKGGHFFGTRSLDRKGRLAGSWEPEEGQVVGAGREAGRLWGQVRWWGELEWREAVRTGREVGWNGREGLWQWFGW
jgi:hypothetical protein